MEKVEYPKWKYHADKEAVIVSSKEAEEALGDGWFDSPADVVPQSESDAELLQEIEKVLHAPKKKRAKA